MIKLDPGVLALGFDIASGAVPGGSMFYQIDCGPPTPVGSPICVDGLTEFALTFCKPGNNLNTYQIITYPGPAVTPDDSTRSNCGTDIEVTGLALGSIQWTDLTGGGTYLNYLSCTNCPNPTFAPDNAAPAYIDYQVCGLPAANSCSSTITWCDTIRMKVLPEIQVNINPDPAIYCENTSGIQLEAQITPVTSNVSFNWTNSSGTSVSNTSGYYAPGPGWYSVDLNDNTFPTCPAQGDSIEVIEEPLPIVNAGNDSIVCGDIPVQIPLNGSVIPGSINYYWQGNGSFSPTSGVLNPTYSPTPGEISAGSATIHLIGEATNVCPDANDQVVITIPPPLVVTHDAPSYVCYNSTSLVTVSASGGMPPYDFAWNTGLSGPSQVLGSGNFSVTVTDASGSCSEIVSFNILEDSAIVVTPGPISPIQCNSTTLISATATGGTGTINLEWSTGATTNTILVGPGLYSVTATDALGCTQQAVLNVPTISSTLYSTIPQPSTICYGDDASVTINAFQGTAPYSYLWENGSTNQTQVLSAGSYCATVTDAASCQYTSCVDIIENPLLSTTITGENLICNDELATVVANPSGGTYPYYYSWSNGTVSPTNFVDTGIYYVTVTDQIGCTAVSSYSIALHNALETDINKNDISCHGLDDGNATISILSGTGPISYSWSPYGGTSPTATQLQPNTYVVNMTDGNGCFYYDTITIIEPLVLEASIDSFQMVNCFGSSNGVALAAASGGTSPFVYDWYPTGGNNALAQNLSAGTYQVLVTDAHGCKDSALFTITQPLPIQVSEVYTTDPKCYNGNDGEISVNTTGGTPSYSYSWNPSVGVTNTVSTLQAGSYTVTVTDANGCADSMGFTLYQPDTLMMELLYKEDVLCYGGNNGVVSIQGLGGAPPYSYAWSNGSTSNTISNLTAGTYLVTITDANGCVVSDAFTVGQPTAALQVTTSPDQGIPCNSSANLTATGLGGTAPYTIAWSNGDVGSPITVNILGQYLVTVTDDHGCTAIDSVALTPTNSTLTLQIYGEDTICSDLQTSLSTAVTGGSLPYDYTWSTSETTSSITVGVGLYCVTVEDNSGCQLNDCHFINESEDIFSQITADTVCQGQPGSLLANPSGGKAPYTYEWSNGSFSASTFGNPDQYHVTITDNLGCTAVDSAIILVDSVDVTTFWVDHISCFGANDGFIQVQTDPAFLPVSYLWTTGATGNSLSGLGPGVFSVTATDRFGCKDSIDVLITQPPTTFNISTSSTDVTCYGNQDGTITLNISGGTPSYDVLWWSSGSNNTLLTGLESGVYPYSVVDSNGCILSDSLTINEPPQLNLTLSQVDSVKCHGQLNGSIEVNGSGGTLPHVYNWSNAQIGSVANNLGAGIYEVTLTDGNSCTKTLTGISVLQPAMMLHNTSISAAICQSFTGEASVLSTGGTQPYSYNWSNGMTGSTLSNVQAGNYQVIISDANFCKDSLALNIPEFSSHVNISPSITPASCIGASDGIISFEGQGGFPPYDYHISTLSVDTNYIEGQPIGFYTLIITDSLTCKDTTVIEITAPDPLLVSAYVTNPSCTNDSDGVVSMTTLGGTTPYHYDWSSGDSTSTIYNQPSGLLTVTVTDFKGCQKVQSVSVINPNPLTITMTNIQDVKCNGTQTGSATALVAGGTGSYTYFWTPSGEATAAADQLHQGMNYVLVRDSNFCLATDSVFLNQPNQIMSSSSPDTLVCSNETILIEAYASGGTGPYNYNWSHGLGAGQLQFISPTTSTVYNVTITDANGCSDSSQNVAIQVYPTLESVTTADKDTICPGDQVLLTTVSSGGMGNYTYTWIEPALGVASSSVYVSPTESTVYTLQTDDDCGTIISYVPVYVESVANIVLEGVPLTGCVPLRVDFQADIENPIPGTQYQWEFGDGNTSNIIDASHTFTEPGEYLVYLTAKTPHGCTSEAIMNDFITALPSPVASFTQSDYVIELSKSTIQFYNHSTDTTDIFWDFGNTDVSTAVHPRYTYEDTGFFDITMVTTNEYGCADTAESEITILPEFTFYIPNAFTPNGSEFNDYFHGKGICIKTAELFVFDRWGDIVYRSEDLNKPWDGTIRNKLAKQDVYVYRINLIDCKNIEHKYLGHVTLLH